MEMALRLSVETRSPLYANEGAMGNQNIIILLNYEGAYPCI